MRRQLVGWRFVRGSEVRLYPKESRALDVLRNAGGVLSSDEVAERVGYRNPRASRRAVHVVLYRLRRKGLVDSITESVEGVVAAEMRLFREGSPSVASWMRRLRSGETREKWLYLFSRYFKWVHEGGRFGSPDTMLENKQNARTDRERFSHVSLVEDYLAEAHLSASQKRSTYSAVRSFYKHNKSALPDYALSFREEGTKMTTQQPVTLEEFKLLIDQAKPREKAMFMCALQCALDRSTLCDVFNYEAYPQICRQLGSEDHTLWDVSRAPVKIDLVRPKTRTKYYNFLSVDALGALQQWLTLRETWTGEKMRMGEPLFISIRRTPLGRDRVSSEFTQLAVSAGLESRKYGKANEVRYRFHSHELRDTFRTSCTIAGVKDNAGEFFLGHRIDRLGYDKSPAVDVEHFRSQYRLVEPYINVLSRQAISTKKVEELEAKIAERDGIVEALLKNGSAKDTEIKDLRERVVRLGEEIKRINDSIEAHSFFRADKVLEARRARKNE
jgi:site-specific recombinase XerD